MMTNAYIFRLGSGVRHDNQWLKTLDRRYTRELMTGQAYVNTYMGQLRKWCNHWSRIHDLLIERIDTTNPLEWPATPGNLQQGSWNDTPCDYFRDIPYLPSLGPPGKSINDVD